ncbi:MAG: tyrosine-type recombinase/integrase [Spirulina sp.]
MYAKNDFRYLSILSQKKGGKNYYAVRLRGNNLNRKTMSVGTDIAMAYNLASEIDEEINCCIVNESPIDLDKLKSIADKAKQAKKQKGQLIRLVEKDSIISLWNKYVSFHINLGKWEETYIFTHVQTITNLLKKCPYQKLEEKTDLIDWLFSDEKRSPATSKSRLKLIVAAIDWNSKTGNIPRKWGIEYRDMLESIKLGKTQQTKIVSHEDDIQIFSLKEVYDILDALKNETHCRFANKHRQYYKYVYFLWLTGCRPSEAVALKWDNVDIKRKRIIFCEGQVIASGRTVKKQGTKTVPSRFFPINAELHDLLSSIPDKTGYVFKNLKGKSISQQALVGVWKRLLESMNIPYRIPYQLRHTMISYHANNDYPIHKLAELVGNSEKTIKDHYLKLEIERIVLPEVLKPTDE